MSPPFLSPHPTSHHLGQEHLMQKTFFLSVKFGKSHMLIQKRANPHKEKSSSWMWSKSKCVWFYMIRMQCRVRVKDVWGHCMHMFPYNYLHFDQNENCNFSRVRLKMINGLVDHSNVSRTALRKLLMLMRRSKAAKNYVKSESGAQQNKAENIAVCCN